MPTNHDLRVGCAGWSIPTGLAGTFPGDGPHLSRYARRFPAVEINSSFYRPHRPSTHARWASETPVGFAFSLKVPKEITHDRRLVGIDDPLARFLDESSSLGAKRGPLLIQLPPSLAFAPGVSTSFFSTFRRLFDGPLACEPRHAGWFTPEADRLLSDHRIARVAADPAVVPLASGPGGWPGLVYFRLHGSPKMYSSAYSAPTLDALADQVASASVSCPVWCIFDNTALGAAPTDALSLMDRLGGLAHE